MAGSKGGGGKRGEIVSPDAPGILPVARTRPRAVERRGGSRWFNHECFA